MTKMLDVKDPNEDTKKSDPTYAALARKRRIELRNLQRAGSSEDEDGSQNESKTAKRVCRRKAEDKNEVLLVDPLTSKPRPSITGIKKQSRYDPGVPMTRDELKAWRKEARRVRNRESAAASRSKNRERITELTSEVDDLRTKYSAALKRIVELEAMVAVHDSFRPATLRQDVALVANEPVSPITVPPEHDEHSGTSSVSSDNVLCNVSLNEAMSHPVMSCGVTEKKHQEEVNQKYRHIMDMISRPIA